jgi:hypothetical protein
MSYTYNFEVPYMSGPRPVMLPVHWLSLNSWHVQCSLFEYLANKSAPELGVRVKLGGGIEGQWIRWW